MTNPFARARRRDTSDQLEIDRIVQLQRVGLPTAEEVEAVSREVVQAEHFERGYRLHREQAAALLAFDLYDGVFGPIGVGRGKTNITLLIADRAFRQGTSARSLLLVPSTIIPQLVQTDIPAARRLFGIRVPFVVLAGRDRASRAAAARSEKRACYIMPYSYLSLRDSEDLLYAIMPDLIQLDEAHRVKNKESARTRRLLRLIAKLPRDKMKMVALSGTITSKSIHDYHHLISHALRDRSPLPLEIALVDSWGVLLDAGAGDDPNSSQTGPIAPLLEWAGEAFPQEKLPRGTPGFRAAYRLRLNSAPGVVSSGDAELGTSILIQNHPCEAPPGEALDTLMKQVEELWISPSGDEIEHGMHKWRHLYELTSGFFYRLRWPEPEELVEQRRLSHDEAVQHIELAKVHHKDQQAYHKELRRWIDNYGRHGLDTPLLVAANMAKHGAAQVTSELYGLWREMKDGEFDGMPERVSEPVRVSPWKVEQVAKQAVIERDEARKDRQPHGVLVWYHHQEFGRWLVEVLEGMGEKPLWCPADSSRPGSSVRLLSPDAVGQIVVVSMGGHGEGKNLQAFQHQLLGEFPRKADMLEQVLGRTHRFGQQADELVPGTFNSCEFDHQNMSACLIDALYTQQTTGTRLKALYASYDPLPNVYPPDFLRERGFVDLPKLDPVVVAKLEEKFGPLVARGAAGR